MNIKQVNNNDKAFTLVELIVVIAIMGIILVLALPQVSKIQSANKTRKYEAYEQTISAAAKIYIDNHKKDLFGNQETGCVTITYEDLKRDNLIKDFSESGVNCNHNNSTKVDVTKEYDQYYYSTDIVCSKDGKEVYTNKESAKEGAIVCNSSDGSIPIDPENGSDGVCEPGEDGCTEGCSSAGCPDPDDTAPDLYARPTSSKEKWYNSKGIKEELKLKFNVYDSSGLNKNISIQWTWTNKDTGTTSTYLHNFKNKASKSTTKLSVLVPENKIPEATGHYSVVLSPNSSSTSYGVQDYLGNVRYTSSRTYEEYWIDNMAPTMNPTIKSKNSNYNSVNTQITLSASDDVGVDQMYISNTGYKTGGKWQNYTNTVDWDVAGSYDGGKRTIYITIRDLAGNETQTTITYTVYKSCTEVEDDGSWRDISDCSEPCDGGVKKQEINQKDKYTKASCGTRSRSNVSCNTQACSKKLYVCRVGPYGAFLHWTKDTTCNQSLNCVLSRTYNTEIEVTGEADGDWYELKNPPTAWGKVHKYIWAGCLSENPYPPDCPGTCRQN